MSIVKLHGSRVPDEYIRIDDEAERDLARSQYPDLPVYTINELQLLQNTSFGHETIRLIHRIKVLFDAVITLDPESDKQITIIDARKPIIPKTSHIH